MSKAMNRILVLVEHDNQSIKAHLRNVLAAAAHFQGEITLAVMGSQCEAIALQASKMPQVAEVLLWEDPSLSSGLAEAVCDNLQAVAKNFQYILAASTTYGKNILPRLAAILGVAQISDVIQILAEDTFERPIYAGNVLMTLKSLDPIKVMTIRITAFDPNVVKNSKSVSESEHSAPIRKMQTIASKPLSIFVSREASPMTRPSLENAAIVISGGRGLQSRENFKLLETLADKLHAAIGATRAAVDAGFISNDFQVGQTGKIVAPKLYIAVGISGAIQHLAGMKESKVIVAINKDPEAPIFQVADYFMVGDLFQILPELIKEISLDSL